MELVKNNVYLRNKAGQAECIRGFSGNLQYCKGKNRNSIG